MERIGLFLGFLLFLSSTGLPIDEERGVIPPIHSNNGCDCEKYTCKCCEYINMVELRGNACLSFSYLPDDYGISVTLTWNNLTIYNETISARNPPAMCFEVPELEKIADICLRLYDLRFSKDFHGCFEIQIVLYHLIHKKVKLGCIEIPAKKFPETYYSHKDKDNNLDATDLHSVVLI